MLNEWEGTWDFRVFKFNINFFFSQQIKGQFCNQTLHLF